MSELEERQLTLFPEDSHVSRSVLPGNSEATKMTVTSGQKCLELSKKSGRLGCLVKTLLTSSIWHSTKCALGWKIKTTKCNRLLFRLAVSMLRTNEIESLFWPTPTATINGPGMNINNPRGIQQGNALATAVVWNYHKMWPTPTARDYKGAVKPETLAAKGRTSSNSLPDAVMAENGGQLNPEWVEWLMGFPIGHTDLNA